MGISPMAKSGHLPQGKPAATESRYPTLITGNYQVHAGSFRISIIHRIPTWTTGSLTCVCDYLLCVRIHTGVGHTDSESAQHFWLEKTLTIFFVCSWPQTGFEHRVLGSGIGRSTNWATSSTQLIGYMERIDRQIDHWYLAPSQPRRSYQGAYGQDRRQ